MDHQNRDQLHIDKNLLSINEAAALSQVSRQAIYIAIKQQKLKAEKNGSRWQIHLSDLKQHCQNKYSRSNSMYQGELIFDHRQGIYSVREAARILKVPVQKIYHAIRYKQIKASRKGAAWIIHMADIKEYQNKHLSDKIVSIQTV